VDKVTPEDEVEAIVASESIDVVLLGVDGLGRKGLDLIPAIQAVSPNTKIIVLNDSRYMDLSIEGMKRGAFDEFLVPLDIDLLADRIREAGSTRKRLEKEKPRFIAPTTGGD
jgi:DNA-binding NtrC family response regulator